MLFIKHTNKLYMVEISLLEIDPINHHSKTFLIMMNIIGMHYLTTFIFQMEHSQNGKELIDSKKILCNGLILKELKPF